MEKLLPPLGMELTWLQNPASKVVGLKLCANKPGQKLGVCTNQETYPQSFAEIRIFLLKIGIFCNICFIQ